MLMIARSPAARSVLLRSLFVCAVLGAALLACRPEPSHDDTVAALFQAFCELNVRCTGGTNAASDCDPDRFCFYPEVSPETRVQGAGACARELRGLDCDRLTSIPTMAPACRLPMLQLADKRGVSGQGGPCRRDLDCVDGLLCDIDAEVQACGMCTPAPGVGEACADGRCAPGAHCDLDDRCRADAVTGEPCEDASACVGFLSCVAGRCQPSSLRDGDACDDHSGESCAGGSTCIDGTCRPQPGEGEACDVGCALGLVCHEETCVGPAACGEGQAGEPCYGGVCAPGLTCDVAHARCVAKASLVAAGEACGFDGDCQSGVCVSGVCTRDETCGVDFGIKRSAAGTKARRARPPRGDWLGSWRSLLPAP